MERAVQYLGRRAIVFRKTDGNGAGIILLQKRKTIGGSAAERIDGLIGIAYGKQTAAFAQPQTNQIVLGGIDVLKLVYVQILKLFSRYFSGKRLCDQIVKIQHARLS